MSAILLLRFPHSRVLPGRYGELVRQCTCIGMRSLVFEGIGVKYLRHCMPRGCPVPVVPFETKRFELPACC
jgi:hypothetical protein